MFGASREIRHRLRQLERHLQNENPLLVEAVRGFRQLDSVGYRLGLLHREQSFATRIPWWPLISVLGTYSAGKSTFINSYINHPLQQTGNQAVDDKFTVICYSNNNESRTLPGLALDADPRFPFYQMADELEKVAPGEGARVDAYLQLKTCPSDRLRGYIFIDSPGFDADAQRTATLQITDYIIDLSDLVLVFFDARHPEVGTMQDTLQHLVSDTINRKDANKFIYILNQMDATAREDNPEDVIAAWQKALSQHGLTAGRFYTIYNKQAAQPIADEAVRDRYEKKAAEDMAAIDNRIQQVHVDRIYRILGNLEKKAREIEQHTVPQIRQLVRHWVRGVIWRDVLAYGLLALAVIGGFIAGGGLDSSSRLRGWLEHLLQLLRDNLWYGIGLGFAVFVLLFVIHHAMRSASLRAVLRQLDEEDSREQESLRRALIRNTRCMRSIFRPEVVGWHRFTRNRLHRVVEQADEAIQQMNNQYTRPSGQGAEH